MICIPHLKITGLMHRAGLVLTEKLIQTFILRRSRLTKKPRVALRLGAFLLYYSLYMNPVRSTAIRYYQNEVSKNHFSHKTKVHN